MKSKKMVLLRYLLQVASLTAFVILVGSLSYPPELGNILLQWFSRLDPWLLLSQLRWHQDIPAWVWLPLLTLGSTMLWGRLFCGWLCPFGALLSVTDKLGRTVFKNLSLTRTNVLYALQPLRYYWLLFVVLVFILSSNWGLFLTPFALFSHEIVRMLQGYFLWLLIGITVATLVFSRFWCSVVCPTGLLLSLLARLRPFRYRLAGNCVHCEQCARTCSVAAAPSHSGCATEGCLVCGDCKRICPTNAIEWQSNSQQPAAADAAAAVHRESRRQFFKTTFAVAVAAALWKRTVWAAANVLRPPGSLPEPEFTAVCNRCGRCVQVCPGNALRPMPITEGLVNFETPHIIPRQNRCDLCLACQEVCPTGAIARVPLEKVRMGTAVVDKSRCIAWNEGKLCYICGEQCPVLAITADEHRPVVLADKCAGCGSCENACPVDGEAAIRVIPR